MHSAPQIVMNVVLHTQCSSEARVITVVRKNINCHAHVFTVNAQSLSARSCLVWLWSVIRDVQLR